MKQARRHPPVPDPEWSTERSAQPAYAADRAGSSLAARRAWAPLSRRFAEGRARLPAGHWRAWWRTLAVGLAAMVALLLLLLAAGRRLAATGALDGEPDLIRAIAAAVPFGFSSAVFFQTFGTDITLIILVAAAAAAAAWARRPLAAVGVISALAVCDVIVRLGWLLWDRARPDVLYDGFASPGFHAFPSGHAAKTTAVYGFLTLLWVRASRSTAERLAAVLALASIISVVTLGRLTMGVHWPSDIAAGVILGAAWVAVLARGLRYEDAARP